MFTWIPVAARGPKWTPGGRRAWVVTARFTEDDMPTTYRYLPRNTPLAPIYYGSDIVPTSIPFESMIEGGSELAHLPIRTLPEPTPDVFLHAWKT